MENSRKIRTSVSDIRFLFVIGSFTILLGIIIFEGYWISSCQTKKAAEGLQLVEAEPAFVCLNETDPLYYVSTFKKLACEAVIALAYKIFLERLASDTEKNSWMIKCIGKNFDISSISWEFTQMEEHFHLLEQKRKLYGYDPTKTEYEVHRITTEAPTASPSIICITALPSDIEMSLPYTPTPAYAIDEAKLTTASPIIETPSTTFETSSTTFETSPTIFETTEISTISSTVTPIMVSTTSPVQSTVPVLTTTNEDQMFTTTNLAIIATSTVPVTSTSIPTQSINDIPTTTVTYNTFTSGIPTNTDSVEISFSTPTQLEEEQNILTTPSYTDTVVEFTKKDSTVPLQIKLKNQEFSKELDDPESDEYKELSDEFKETMSGMLDDVPGFKEVRVLGFKNGSLVVIYEVVFENTDVITNQTNEVRENISNVENGTTTYNSTQLEFIEVAKTKVIKAIETSLSNPEKRVKSSNNSIILDEDFDLDSLDIAPREVVENLKIKPKTFKRILSVEVKGNEFNLQEANTTAVLINTKNVTEKNTINPFQVVFMKLRVTNMNFTQNLTDRNNLEFRRLEKKFTELLNPLLLSLDNYAGMEVMGFSTGSLIANNELYFREEIPANLSVKVKDRINAAASYFRYLNVRVDEDATEILKPGEADLCEFVTCNMFSKCVERSKYQAECVCRPGYVQVDPNVCVSSCDLDPHYCKNGGKCESSLENGAKCSCRVSYNWAYTGERCEKLVSHAVVIMSATSALVLLASILAVVALCYYAVTGTEDTKLRKRPEISAPQATSFPTSLSDVTNDCRFINEQFTQSNRQLQATSSIYSSSDTNQCHGHSAFCSEIILFSRDSKNKKRKQKDCPNVVQSSFNGPSGRDEDARRPIPF